MNRKTMLIIAVTALAIAPLAAAQTHLAPGNPNCQPNDQIHSFTQFAGMPMKTHAPTPPASMSARDGNIAICPGDTLPGAYDGDTEFGYGGNFFPAGTYAGSSYCDTATPSNGISGWIGTASIHHNAGPGAQYWAHNTPITAGDLMFTAGTDGPTIGNLPCQTNNIISDNPITDPWDCPGDVAGRDAAGNAIPGFGITPGYSTIGAGRHAFDGTTTGPNAHTTGDPTHNAIHDGTALGIIESDTCQPWDGVVTTFYLSGVFEVTTIYISTPSVGDASG